MAGELKPPAATPAEPLRRRLPANARDWLALLFRPPRAERAPGLAVARSPGARLPHRARAHRRHHGAAGCAAVIAVEGLPGWVEQLFNVLTDYGTSDWFLVPIGLVLLVIAGL